MDLRVIRFTPAVGSFREEFPIEVPGTTQFQNVVNEVGKKLNLSNENIVVHPPGGATLTYSDYKKTVNEIIDIYGEKFRIINRGIVGK